MPVSSGKQVFRALPVRSGDIDSAGVSVASDQDIQDTQNNLLSPNTARSNDDSLTFSEDSDTTRIYNLSTRETKIVVPVEENLIESPIESPVKLAKQFFNGAPKKFPTIRKMDDEVTTVIRTSNQSLMNGNNSVGYRSFVTLTDQILIVCLIASGTCGARSIRGKASN